MADPNARRAFGTLVAAACIDGRLSDSEKQILHRKATEMDIPVRLMNELFDQGTQGKLAISVPPTAPEREALLDGLIDIVCADGRVEAPEHHLIAKFASHVGVALPDLRARVRERMSKQPPAPARLQPRVDEIPVSPKPRPPEIRLPDPPKLAPVAAPPPPAPVSPPRAVDTGLPPVTLQLVRSAIMFDSRTEAIGHVQRILGCARPEAERAIRAVTAAFPDLKSRT